MHRAERGQTDRTIAPNIGPLPLDRAHMAAASRSCGWVLLLASRLRRGRNQGIRIEDPVRIHGLLHRRERCRHDRALLLLIPRAMVFSNRMMMSDRAAMGQDGI